MTDENAFLAAIAATPADAMPRLAYADWLEERGDSRHELVRVCEAMRREPVFSDEYWRLKARRNELRPGCPADWLAATGTDGSRYDPIFRDGVPDGWRERWRLIREFTERWHGIPMPDVGGRADEIAATEARLGLSLPPSVREWVAFITDIAEGEARVGRDPFGLQRVDDLTALSLHMQAEGDMHWAVRFGDLGHPDPEVRLFTVEYAQGVEVLREPSRQAWAATVSEFAFGFLFTYLYTTRAKGRTRWPFVPSEGPFWRGRIDSWEIVEGIGQIGVRNGSRRTKSSKTPVRYAWR